MARCEVLSTGKASHAAPARFSHNPLSRCPVSTTKRVVKCQAQHEGTENAHVTRRALGYLCGAGLTASVVGGFAEPAKAVQGYTAGRVPGLSTTPDEEGFFTYIRPEGKSGGHGVGWSEIPPYSFRVPEGWTEEPVSIADLGGTEIDLRFGNSSQGELFVVVAPVLRFRDVGFNADVRIEELAPPENVIEGFAPELFGRPLEEGDVIETQVAKQDDLTYYMWEVKPHRLVVATAFKNRLFILGTEANGRQWRRSEDALRTVQKSFRVAVA